jgi:GT2 family glycosyltransferase
MMEPVTERLHSPSVSLDIIIVNWNGGQLLRRCLDSIWSAQKTSLNLERVVVVDNGSVDGSADGLQSPGPPLCLISNKNNRGFAAGCNQGAAGSHADYLLFLNPDTRLHATTLTRPLEFMEEPKSETVGICGVRHVDESGGTTTSCARFPSLSIFLWKMTGLAPLFPNAFPNHLMTREECSRSREVDQVIGAYFLVRRALFEVLNGFDERFFVYFEEVDFSLRAKRRGYASYYLADVSIYHRGGGSSERAKALRLFYSLRSRILYAFKNFSQLEALTLCFLTLTVEPVSRLLAATLSLSATSVREVIGGYLELLRYFLRKDSKWRS